MHYHGHRERLRERLRENPDLLPDYEILELLLGQVIPRRDTKALAKDLLDRFQSIKGVLDAKAAELLDLQGFGPAVADYWLLLREILARYAESPLRLREALASPAAVADMARTRLAGQTQEEIWVAFVDTQNHLLSWERAQKGAVDSAALHPRNVLERAILLRASGFILVHNHPGGNACPSGADLEMTRQIRQSAQVLGLRFLDHIIVTDTRIHSLVNEGMFPG